MRLLTGFIELFRVKVTRIVMGERPFKKKPLSMELTNENGWFLTPEGLDLCNNCYEDAIDMDLNEIGAPSLPEELGKGKVDIVKGGMLTNFPSISP